MADKRDEAAGGERRPVGERGASEPPIDVTIESSPEDLERGGKVAASPKGDAGGLDVQAHTSGAGGALESSEDTLLTKELKIEVLGERLNQALTSKVFELQKYTNVYAI